MTLKTRALLLLVIFLLLLMSFLGFASSYVLINGFERVEKQWDMENLARVKEGFEAGVDNMAVKSADWAIWSDTYNYVADPKSHPDYVTSNLNDVSFSNLMIDHFFLINTQGDFIYDHSFDCDTSTALKTPAGLVDYFKGKSPLLVHPKIDEALKGVLMVGHLPIIFVSRAILTSEKTGPSHGTLAFFRDIDTYYLDKLSGILKFKLALITPDQEVFKGESAKLSDQHPFALQVVNGDLSYGYVLIDDYFGKPAFILQVPMNRAISKEALKTRAVILVSFFIISFMCGIIFILYLNKLLLDRIFNVSRDIRSLHQKPGARLAVVLNDEISALAQTINEMLDRLDDNARQAKKFEEQIRLKDQEFLKKQTLQLEELQAAKKEAETASRAKSQFLANMSHEIRTPLNAILGFSDLLKNTPINDEQQKYLETITISGHLLASVINDILDISKIEAGKVHLETIDFDLSHQLEQAINISRSKIHGKEIDMCLEYDPDLPRFFKGDSTRLQQVIVNLISNAAKFTERGKIVISARRRQELDQPVQKMIGIWIVVQDTGIGIPKDKIDHLFQPFHQADASTTRKFGGTGLGLAICKSLIELMGGRIWVESQEGKGSCFQFEIVLIEGNAPQKEVLSAHKVDVKGVRIFVVEDSKPNQDLIRAYCRMMGVEADFANNGKEAVDHLMLHKDYLLVIMDMQMPIMDGIEATRIIRTGIDKNIPIIALTAAVLKEDQENCLAAGMNGFLTKPIDINKLKETIVKYIPSHSVNASILAAGAELGLEPAEYLEILKEALAMASNDVVSLREAIASGDYARIKSIAHRLKGTFANLRCGILAQIMARINEKAAQSQGLEEIKKDVEDFSFQLDLINRTQEG